MNLYLISQTENSNYDTFDSAVVAAPDEAAARSINPGGPARWGDRCWCASPEAVTVRWIGVAADGIEPKVLLASFNAG